MQYTENFLRCKIENFITNKFDIFNIIFFSDENHSIAKNIDRGYKVGFKGVYMSWTCFPDVFFVSC